MMLSTQEILNREDVSAALHFDGPPRPPRVLSLWHNEETQQGNEEQWSQILRNYPDDCIMGGVGCGYWDAPADDPNYRWAFGDMTKPAHLPAFACPIITDWNQLDQFLAEMPNPDQPCIADSVSKLRQEHPHRYILIGFGHYFHQRLAYIRGLENLLCDFHDHKAHLKKLMAALLHIYSGWAEMLHRAGADGVWAGDDLGTQLSLFMSPAIFRELYKPFYADLADILHSNNLDFWLHSCGNVTKVMPDLIDVGIDALHPIQAGTMDDAQIAQTYGGKIAFWIGMDVQQVIPLGTPDDVREHVRQRLRTFYRPSGGLIVAAGNAIMQNSPIENVRAYAETIREPIPSRRL